MFRSLESKRLTILERVFSSESGSVERLLLKDISSIDKMTECLENETLDVN
jgi:hypothetical protein